MMYAPLTIYSVGVVVCWVLCARYATRRGCWKEDGRIAAVSLLWSLMWPLTVVFVGLGWIVRRLAR